MTANAFYTYSGDILPVGVARAEPIITNFLAIQAAFAKLDTDALDRILELLEEIFPSLEDGGAIFSKYWDVVTEPVTYGLSLTDYGTHIIPLGYDGDLTLTLGPWPSQGTKFGTVILGNGGRAIVRWPLNVQWQTRGGIPPVLKENGFDTIVLWRDPFIQTVLGQDVILAARAGR